MGDNGHNSPLKVGINPTKVVGG